MRAVNSPAFLGGKLHRYGCRRANFFSMNFLDAKVGLFSVTLKKRKSYMRKSVQKEVKVQELF